jgi:hypothetical protein
MHNPRFNHWFHPRAKLALLDMSLWTLLALSRAQAPSALPPQADMSDVEIDVCFVPQADIITPIAWTLGFGAAVN